VTLIFVLLQDAQAPVSVRRHILVVTFLLVDRRVYARTVGLVHSVISIPALGRIVVATERAKLPETLISHANAMLDFLEKAVKLHAVIIVVEVGGNILLAVQLIFPV